MHVVEEYRQHLESYLTKALPGTRLPGERDLAKSWGCSVATVRRVMNTFVESGQIRRVQGKGTFARTLPPPAFPTDYPGDAPGRIMSVLTRAISSGDLPVGTRLPDIKQLCALHHASASTLIAALRRMADLGLLSRTGRNYSVGVTALPVPQRTRQILFFNCSGSDLGDLTSRSEMQLQLFRAFDREIVKAAVRIRYRTGSDLERYAAHPATLPASVCGIAADALSPSQYERVIDQIKAIGDPRNRPIQSMILTGSHTRPSAGIHQLCTGTITTSRARTLTEFVRTRSFPGIALFQDLSLSGHTEFIYNLKFVRDMAHFCPTVNVHVVNRICGQHANPQKEFATLCQKIEEDHRDRFLSKYREYHFHDSWKKMKVVTQFQYRQYLDWPLWVFAADADAVKALAWLERNRIAVPATQQIISLEGSDQYYGKGISLCGTDWESTGYLMAHALIGDIPIARTSHGFLRIRSLIVERQTTA